MSSDPHRDTGANAQLRLGALIGVLGVVYGDIGTSPLYALQTCLAYFTGKGLSSSDILGLLSLIVWSLIITVTLKYVTFVMRADNHGEGGILALMALAQRVAKSDRTRTFLGLVGITGAGLFFGDGMITPAISVLSAVSGLQVVWPTLSNDLVEADLAGRHRRAVPVAEARHRQHGAGLRPCHGRLVHRHRPARPCPGRAAPLHLQALLPSYGILFMLHHKFAAFVVARRGRAGGYRRRGPVCGYEPFRPQAHPSRLDLFRPAQPAAELFRPGRAGAGRPLDGGQSVLQACPALRCKFRWSCCPPSPPSSPARRSFPAPSPWRGNASSSACFRAWRSATLRRRRKARSTCRRPMPCWRWASSCWFSPSRPATPWPGPMASR